MRHYIRLYFMAGFAASALALSGCADAQSADKAEAVKDLSSTATSWDVQPDGSYIRFSATQEGEAFTGAFTEFSGVIRFDPEAPETGVVDITIPLSSVEAGSTDRNSTLPGKVWFSTKAFPTGKFTSDDISKQGAGFLAKGELTLKGTSVPLDLPFRLKIEGDQAVMTGDVTLDRTKWDVGSAPWDTDEWVSRDVALDIQVTATRSD